MPLVQQTPMVRLASVNNGFHARVIAARLGSEGIVTELRGCVDGPYPMGDVYVYVGEEDLGDAQQLLMVDEVESAFDEGCADPETSYSTQPWLVVAAFVILASIALSRLF